MIVGAPSGFGVFWFVPYAGVGALLAIRRPRTSIGWILLGIGWCLAMATITVDATVKGFAEGPVDPITAGLAVITSIAGTTGFVLFGLLAIVFPSGHMPSGRWRGPAQLAVAVACATLALSVVMPFISVNVWGAPTSVPVRNPAALLPDLAIWQVITPDDVIVPVIVLLVASAISVVVRFRRATGVERQQLRWFTAALAFVVLAVMAGFGIATVVPGAMESGLAWLGAVVAFPCVAIAVGIAVLRYRLYEIDRIISRTIGWAIVTGVLVFVFAAGVVLLQAVLAPFTNENTLAVAGSTLVAFALFQPLRRRVQAFRGPPVRSRALRRAARRGRLRRTPAIGCRSRFPALLAGRHRGPGRAAGEHVRLANHEGDPMTDPRSSARNGGRVTGWRAALVWLVVGGMVALSTACALLIPEQEAMPTWALIVFTVMAASLGFVGALVVTRQPRNAVGWILWASSVAVAASTVAGAYSNLTVTLEGPVTPGTAFIAWVSQVGLTPAITGIIIFIPLLFPDGRVLSRRWRWVAVYGATVIGLVLAANMFAPGPLGDYPTIDNPFGLPAIVSAGQLFEFAKGPGVMIAAVLAIASSVARYRRATTIERAQLRWFGAAAGFTISLFTLSIVASAPGIDIQALADFGWLGGIMSLSLIPIAIGVAILRYRLYQIDRIISRSLSWAVMSAVLIAVSAAVVVSLQNVLQPVTHENTLAVAASTLVAAALFQPLRRRVQRGVDRRFDRARYDGQRVADSFAASLRSDVDLVSLRASLAAAADDAVRPAGSGVWLSSRGRSA